MKNIIFLGFLSITLNVNAIKVKFSVSNMSTNIAEGSIGVLTSFQIYPSNYIQMDSTDFIELLDFPNINYYDIESVIIEKAILSTDVTPIFNVIQSFQIIDSITFGDYPDTQILQGNSYAYRIKITTFGNQNFNLFNRYATTQLADPVINCAKYNNVYRMSGHNTYQKSVSNSLYNSLFSTRVLELDAHIPFFSSAYQNIWSVAHTNNTFIFGNNNNCGSGNKDFSICLNDILNWHNNYPNHDPITVFIDIYSWLSSHTPSGFDNLLIQKFGFNNIYKPRDLVGNGFGDMRVAAQQNNWPSMGDLTGKFIFVLTGNGGKISEYIANRSLNAVAFSSAKVQTIFDVVLLPDIWQGLKNDIVFYNMQQFNDAPFTGGDADFNIGYLTANLGYINRTYGIGFFGQPGNYNNSEYTHAINFNMNNIAVGNITNTFVPSNSKPENGVQYVPDINYSGLVNNHIYSNYQNVTQAATQNIVATSLIVEPGAHYRMMAGNSIDLQPGVDFKAGSDVDVRIDDCTGANYNLRQANPIQLTQEEIDALMHELNKDLYGYQPTDEENIERLIAYPNPATHTFNISYRHYLLTQATLTVYDITGRMVKTKTYEPQQIGLQNFTLNINDLNEGTYFYILQVGKQTKNGKLVKIN